ncbi:tetratricopeptide repeat protein [Anaeromyxobacter sp. SG66]|uniref:tetratricopeptide repeat protein n=1 Tax=Anaeromyxobacter sp. SG66 TaxID=2925410 RepID=UPI001F5A3796|nr:tetratricopeptide repeat protein [Anaeromyxobacter sp. SG66]
MRPLARNASAALVVLLGCAGGGAAAPSEVEALRAEVRALRADNEVLARKVDGLSARMELAGARAARDPAPRRAPAAEALPPVVPPDLAVVRVEPSEPPPVVLRMAPSEPLPAVVPAAGAPQPRRPPPPVPTALPLAEPAPERLEARALGGGRELSVEADRELRAARRRDGVARAHALEDFVARYPRHPAADNALVEAAESYAAAGKDDAACALAARAGDDYPAGDALSGALERLAACESRRGSASAERRILERLVTEFPRTPAAERAGTRLAAISGQGGDTSPRVPARSGP